MKENIDSKSIGNRKFIIELRFKHKVTLSDKKGAIIENIKSCNFFNVSFAFANAAESSLSSAHIDTVTCSA